MANQLVRVHFFLVLLVLFVVACDNEPYVPLEDQLTFEECRTAARALVTHLNAHFPLAEEDVYESSLLTISSFQVRIRERDFDFREALKICSFKQLLAEKNGAYSDLDYSIAETAWFALVTNLSTLTEEDERPHVTQQWKTERTNELARMALWSLGHQIGEKPAGLTPPNSSK